jgi:Arc/MetJ-type ribon-helix-helix transcriptional regulator
VENTLEKIPENISECIQKAIATGNYLNASDFVRTAIKEKLHREGFLNNTASNYWKNNHQVKNIMTTINNFKKIKNDICGRHGCSKEATRQIIFPLGFSAGFCSQCAEELVQDKIGVENSRNIIIEETAVT